MIAFDPDLRRKLADGTPRAVLDRAFRIRAGLQGALASCLCAYPIVEYATATCHDGRCPAHAIIESQRRAMDASR